MWLDERDSERLSGIDSPGPTQYHVLHNVTGF